MTRTALFAALLASAPTVSLASPLQVSVEDGPVSDSLVEGVARELPEATVGQGLEDPALRVRAVPDGAALAVFVTTRRGATLLARRIPLDPEDDKPALRVATLLIAQTARAFAAAPTEVDPPPPTETATAGPPARTASGPPPESETATVAAAEPIATDPPPVTETATEAPPGAPPAAPRPPAARAVRPPEPERAPPAAPDTTRTSTEAVAARWLEVQAGLTVGGWLRPATPLVGFFGGVGVRWGRLTTSARAEVAGLLCCRLSDARFDGRALEVAMLAEARVRLARWGPVDLAGAAAVGVAYVRVTGRPDDDPSFPVPLAEQTRSTWDPKGRLVLGLQWSPWPDGPTFGLWAGAQLQADRLRVDLPARDGAAPPVDAGVVMPWFALSGSWPVL